jgi:hypothetical protein
VLKRSLFLSILIGFPAWESDLDSNTALSRNCRSQDSLFPITGFSLCLGALADECPPPPFTFTDEETLGYAGWQIATGAWAILSICSSFLAAYYFFKKQERDLADELEQHLKDIKNTNKNLEQQIRNIRVE